jgi:predicted protein tyrosine phosphatase
MIQLLVLSREEARSVAPQVPYIVISITDPEKEDAVIADSYLRLAIFRLKFHDILGTDSVLLADSSSTYERAMTQKEAQAALNFVREHLEKVKLIVCHCEAGISRSAAVAAALSRMLNSQDQFFFDNYWPNRWVYELLLKNEHLLSNRLTNSIEDE